MSDELDKFHSRKKKIKIGGGHSKEMFVNYKKTTDKIKRAATLASPSVAAQTERKHHKKLNWSDEIKLQNFEDPTKINPKLITVTGHFWRRYRRRNKKFVINLHFNEFPPNLSRNQICK